MNSYTKTMEQIQSAQGHKTVFYGAQMLNIVWETKPEVIAKLLPAPLKPVEGKPLVSVFIANYPKTSFAPPYKEAGLFIMAECDGVVGRYCLSMPITDGMAMAMGREVCGLPKKMADIELDIQDGKLSGSISRNGYKFFSMSSDVLQKSDDALMKELKDDVECPMYNVMYVKAVDGSGYLLEPTLIRQGLSSADIKENKLAETKVELLDSPHDPWAELEVVKMVGSQYIVSTNTLEAGEILHSNKINPMSFVPFSFNKWDWWGK
ncbi:MAG: acetoacetate decarboxylase family protein [Sphaerochaeta sp.]